MKSSRAQSRRIWSSGGTGSLRWWALPVTAPPKRHSPHELRDRQGAHGSPGAQCLLPPGASGTMPFTMFSSLGRELRDSLRGEVYLDEISRGIYATDASHYQMMPVAVAVP